MSVLRVCAEILRASENALDCIAPGGFLQEGGVGGVEGGQRESEKAIERESEKAKKRESEERIGEWAKARLLRDPAPEF